MLAPEPRPAAKPKLLPFAKIPGPKREGHPFSTLNLTKASGHPIDLRVSAALWLLRVSQGWTQREIAERVGKPRPHLSKLERGKGCYVGTFCLYAKALGITPYGLLVIAEAIQ